MSITATPVFHLSAAATPEALVTSLNLKSPWLRYNLLVTWFPVKKRSGLLSLLKSPTATPPPLKMYSLVSMLKLSVSTIWLLNVIPEWLDETWEKSVSSCFSEQEITNIETSVVKTKCLNIVVEDIYRLIKG